MDTTPDEAFTIPLNTEIPVATPNVVPVLERLAPVVKLPILKLGFVLFPIVLPEMVKLPAVPAVLIPLIEPLIVAVVPMASIAPMVLF